MQTCSAPATRKGGRGRFRVFLAAVGCVPADPAAAFAGGRVNRVRPDGVSLTSLTTGTRAGYDPLSWSRSQWPRCNPVAEVSAKRVGYAAIALGVLAALVAVLADPLGIGSREGIGLHQSALLAMGVIVAVGGGLLTRGSVSAKRVGYAVFALGALAVLLAVDISIRAAMN